MSWRPAALYTRLALRVRRGMGERAGERRFPGRPQAAGIELEAYRPYTPGDDLRHLDWHALGRLDVLLVRRYTAEREVLFHLLVDGSASMDVPADDGKLAAARELAMALGWRWAATTPWGWRCSPAVGVRPWCRPHTGGGRASVGSASDSVAPARPARSIWGPPSRPTRATSRRLAPRS
jgi:hypothetical protein